MAYVLIEGYLCERCGYRWGARTGTGYRAKTDPHTCPKCKTPYWNRPRRAKPSDGQTRCAVEPGTGESNSRLNCSRGPRR